MNIPYTEIHLPTFSKAHWKLGNVLLSKALQCWLNETCGVVFKTASK